MSASAGRLLGRLSRRDCDLVEVAALIEKDPVLSAQVVQSANSASFSRAHQVESVRHAIVMVGLGAVRKFAVARTISNLFSRRSHASTFSMTRFNLHSVAMGVMLELLAEQAPLEYPEGAFLSGLFHDVGTLLDRRVHAGTIRQHSGNDRYFGGASGRVRTGFAGHRPRGAFRSGPRTLGPG